MSLIAELKQVMYDIPLINGSGRSKFAHFCEHDNIHIRFTKARSIWHAITPTAIKPWWLILEPVRTTRKTHVDNRVNNTTSNTTNKNNNLDLTLEPEV